MRSKQAIRAGRIGVRDSLRTGKITGNFLRFRPFRRSLAKIDSLLIRNRVFFSPEQGIQPSEQRIHNPQALMLFIFSAQRAEIDSTPHVSSGAARR
jgi:hypothetical protein